MPEHRAYFLHRDGILASDGGPPKFVAQYLNEQPETCAYRYAYGRVCDAGPNEHKWWENRQSHPEVHEPSIFDHYFAPRKAV
jgi:hypothetical protein